MKDLLKDLQELDYQLDNLTVALNKLSDEVEQLQKDLDEIAKELEEVKTKELVAWACTKEGINRLLSEIFGE